MNLLSRESVIQFIEIYYGPTGVKCRCIKISAQLRDFVDDQGLPSEYSLLTEKRV